MSKKWLWVTIGAAVVVAFVAGMVMAQEWRLMCLPERYYEPYTPTLVEFKKVEFNAVHNGAEPLTDHLQQTGCRLYDLVMFMSLLVDTKTTSGWDMYQGDGHFTCADEEVRATYAEAAEVVMSSLLFEFPELDDKDVRIGFKIEGTNVGTWRGGKLTLEGEE